MTTSGQPMADQGAAVFAGREFGFNRRDFRRIADMLYADAGIHLTDTKAPLVYSRLVRRLREIGVESFARYCALVESHSGAAERQHMLGALTTNVTSFFREPHHFEHLTVQVLPGLLDVVRQGGRLRIWSAGCSTGEEPYSIALSILELMPDAARFDVRVLATDINTAVLEHGEAGEYDQTALGPVSRRLRSEWFLSSTDADGRKAWRVGDDLRSMVTFRHLNLLKAWPMSAAYQAIFCRNVLIYFDEARQTEIQGRMTALLAPSGRFYLGASERLKETAGLLSDGVTVYRLDDRANRQPEPTETR
ncbi:MAG: protein-glutamate O-methyltransferase [Ramlibacter sp.]